MERHECPWDFLFEGLEYGAEDCMDFRYVEDQTDAFARDIPALNVDYQNE